MSRSQRQFWKHDVKVARDFNNKSSNPGTNNNSSGDRLLTLKFADEFAEFQENVRSTDHLRNLGRSTYQNTWSPTMTFQQNGRGAVADGGGERLRKMSLAEIEHFYMNMSQPLHKNVDTRYLLVQHIFFS